MSASRGATVLIPGRLTRDRALRGYCVGLPQLRRALRVAGSLVLFFLGFALLGKVSVVRRGLGVELAARLEVSMPSGAALGQPVLEYQRHDACLP